MENNNDEEDTNDGDFKESPPNFPGNSINKKIQVLARPESGVGKNPVAVVRDKKLVKKKIAGKAKRKKKSFVESFSETFFGDDAKSVMDHLIYEVLVPAAKETLQDMVSGGIEMLLFGETSRRRSSRNRGVNKVSYGSMYRPSGREEPENRKRSNRGRYNLDDCLFENGDEAADVLSSLIDLLDEYQQATVADFYELAGLDGGSWVDQRWGWTNLNRAYCTHVRGGYIIKLPEPKELE